LRVRCPSKRIIEERITGRFFDPLKMAESIMDLRTHEYKDSRKLEQNKNVIGKQDEI